MDFDFGHLWSLFLGTIIGILPISNPLASAPTFLAITEGDSEEYRREQARRACLYVVCILCSFLLGGTFIMQFFSISIPGIRIAGGILVVKVSMDMLAGKLMATPDSTQRAAVRKRDISFTPLAIPMLSGPGSIGVTLGFTSLARQWYDYIAIIAGICVVAVIGYQTLTLSSRIVKIMGSVGLNAMTQVMGLLLMCMGVQFCVNGVTDIVSDPTFLNAVKKIWLAPM
ncbi:MAG: MarC family NAAT transporter [Puniceicoccales bacterium]|jgi:multiple antibiotic resistance protein|nr:MarC family NAAT transporter [Puniceicoccales bacterium]